MQMNRDGKNYAVGSIMLMLAAFFWGTAFVAQSDAMSSIGPMTFSGLRSLLGGIVLIPIYLLTSGGKAREPFRRENIKKTLTAGAVCGVIMYFAMNLQQIGLMRASAGKAAFITALYIIFVPIFGSFMGKRPGALVWIGACVATVGFYLLNVRAGEGFGLGFWEILVLICSVMFTFHILAVDKFVADMNAALLSSMQFIVTGALSLATCFIDTAWLGYESLTPSVLGSVWFNIAYMGIFSCGVAYTLQIAGQRRVPSATASLLMSFESVFAVLAAWLLMDEALEPLQAIGCALIFIAVVVAQIPGGKPKEKSVDTSDTLGGD
ncbi:MAG: DMT family transporter [Clostridia bacterium]|nr:DMT family transporter [Clostridia bacterium]